MSTMPANASGTLPTPPDLLDEVAFDRTAPIREAMKPEDAPRYALDAFHAAGKALWTVPNVLPYRPRMLRLDDFDVTHFDAYSDYACALRFVQTQILGHIQPVNTRPALALEGWRLRDLMLTYADALAFKGNFDAELIDRVRKGGGQRDLVEDLIVLVAAFLALPEGKTGPDAPVTRADLERASEIADEMHVKVGNPAVADASRTKLLEERRKLGGLILRSQSQIRRAMTFIRWDEGDAADLVPTLFAPRSRKSRRAPAD